MVALMENCRNLQTKLTENDSSDVDAIELFEELKLLCRLVKPNSSPQDVLKLTISQNL